MGQGRASRGRCLAQVVILLIDEVDALLTKAVDQRPASTHFSTAASGCLQLTPNFFEDSVLRRLGHVAQIIRMRV